MPVAFAVTEDALRTEPEPGQKKRGRPVGSTTGARVETQLRDELTMMLKLGAMLWAQKDPVCAPVLNQQAELIAGDIAKFAAKSKWAKKYAEKVAGLGEIIPFMMHLAPVINVINTHHIQPAREQRQAEEENVVTGPWPNHSPE